MKREFIYVPSFLRKWQFLGFSEDDLRTLELQVIQSPDCGAVIEGTGGIRKLRFAFPNRGKSGSARVCYVDFAAYSKTYFLHVYAKEEKANLSATEKVQLRTLVKNLKTECKREK